MSQHSPVLIGHSHSILIFHAAQEAGFELRGQPLATGPQPPHNDDISSFHPEIESLLSEGTVFSLINRSVHDILSIIQHPRPFDFVIPGWSDFPFEPGCEVIPYQAFRAQLVRLMEPDLKLIELASRVAEDRVVQILSQPPLESAELIRTWAPWPLEEGQSIAPASVRLRTYMVYADILAEWCSSLGIPLIRPPSSAVTERGFLKEGLHSNATHANVAYGHLVLQQMREFA
ncbi:hypothetical protein [Ensifer canadensis]